MEIVSNMENLIVYVVKCVGVVEFVFCLMISLFVGMYLMVIFLFYVCSYIGLIIWGGSL